MDAFSLGEIQAVVSELHESKLEGSDEVVTGYCHDEFPIHIVTSEIVAMWSERGKKGRPWLNTSTIDAIVMYRGGRERLRSVYIGASYSETLLNDVSDSFIRKVRDVLSLDLSVVMIVNVRQNHWIVLHLQEDICRFYDPMSASQFNTGVLYFAARVYGKVDEFISLFPIERGSGGRLVSARSQVQDLSFFHSVSVGIQLEEGEGYNCGLYCALWARSFVFGSRRIVKYTKEKMDGERKKWEEVLGGELNVYH